jgi:tetratricopeptide (TPR) repeat protein
MDDIGTWDTMGSFFKMELTLDQALQKGVEAHKAGKAQEADQYYTAILKVNPKHPDANHNMGVLAVGLGKVDAALPFFKTALEVNPSIAQYWLSYIDVLIKIGQIADAKAVLDQAKSIGAKGDAFHKLEKQLAKRGKKQEPTQKQVQHLINLYTQGQHQETINLTSKLLIQFPNSINLYNIIGAANQNLGKLDEAIEAYTKALSIKPDYAEAYNNMGNALKDQGKTRRSR